MIIQAHRGASGIAPENTRSAFMKAIELGAHGIETDVHMSKDGKIVICHDGNIQRTSNGAGVIYDMTLDQLRSYDFGVKFPGWQKKETIMTLDELLQVLRPTNLELNIEFKFDSVIYPKIEEIVLGHVDDAGMGSRVMYSSFNHYCLKRVKQINPHAPIGLLYSAALYEPREYARYVGADYIHPYYFTLLAAEQVQNCHKHGIGVHPWTVDNPEHLKLMASMGVDRVITNYPDRALVI